MGKYITRDEWTKSLKHYDRLIKATIEGIASGGFAEYFKLHGKYIHLYLSAVIKENHNGRHCALCMKYCTDEGTCDSCPLYLNNHECEDEGSEWIALNRASYEGDVISYLRRLKIMRKVLANLPRRFRMNDKDLALYKRWE